MGFEAERPDLDDSELVRSEDRLAQQADFDDGTGGVSGEDFFDQHEVLPKDDFAVLVAGVYEERQVIVFVRVVIQVVLLGVGLLEVGLFGFGVFGIGVALLGFGQAAEAEAAGDVLEAADASDVLLLDD